MLDLQTEVSDSVVRASQGENLTTYEQGILASLLNPSLSIELAVPEGTEPQELYRNLSVCIKALAYLDRTSIRIKPLVGRMLRLIQRQPKVYQQFGYRNFEDFLTKGVCEKLGLSRSNLYECKQIADKWPSMTVEQYAKIGATKLAIISRFCDENSAMASRMLKRAETNSISELRVWAEEKKLIDSGELNAAVIVINTNRTVANQWNEMLNNPQVAATVGSAQPGEIFLAMIREFSSTWQAERA